ncbi:MAG: hypothetical protein WAM66_05535 [Acidobacteriaceae bacterium]
MDKEKEEELLRNINIWMAMGKGGLPLSGFPRQCFVSLRFIRFM